MEISIVAPVFNEEGNILSLYTDITRVLRNKGYNFEIILVDDASTDKSLEEMKKLKPVKIVSFRKNYGQTAALDAGFKEAKGDYVVTIDADLQNDPEDIPAMIDYLEAQNLDLVCGWRKRRRDKFSKRFISRGANLLRKLIINDGVHDSGCPLKVVRRACLEGLDLYGDTHRFIPALLKNKGYRVGEMVVRHRSRRFGKSKYGLGRVVRGLLDMLAVGFLGRYSARPLHLFGSLGFILMFISIITGSYAIYQKFALGYDLSNNFLASLSLFGFLIGIQLIVFGLLADMISRIYFSKTEETPYNIREIIENK